MLQTTRRTIARYVNLFRKPDSLFPGVETILYPNGAAEIWLKTADGLGVRIHASNGPHGLGVIVSSLAGTPDVSSFTEDSTEHELTQYRQTPAAGAFKRWYRRQETAADVAQLGPEYRRPAVE